jgi:DNA polymerase-4
MEEESFFGHTLTVKVKYADFRIITRSKTLSSKRMDFRTMWTAAREIMQGIDLSIQPVRLLGFGVSHAVEEKTPDTQLQLKLF